ncbi:MAG: Sec-dependent nitrous-oxide reductase [Bdellovibrionales bacterium]|nr:Sec-dependent nitrous-oxide reductase [Bdellovibrionales bacterium]
MKTFKIILLLIIGALLTNSCTGGSSGGDILASDAAQKVYVKPGEWDKVYWFMSGGYSGNLTVHGIPSGRLLKTIPVFSVFPENGYGFELETKQLLNTSHGFLPWDDSHHPTLSQTDGDSDGRWLFINGNNTPRIARIDLSSFETKEIIEIPNSAGNHASPYLTENTEYVFAATRFSVPVPQKSIPISDFSKGKFYGTITAITVDGKTKSESKMKIAWQLLVPGFNYDISHCGKGPSHDWCFFSSYNTEQAYKMLEKNASKNDKDFILAVNWKKAEACVAAGKAKPFIGKHAHNYHNEGTIAVSKIKNTIKMLRPKDCPEVAYYIPTPKSPHGVDVDPTGKYIVAGGKLAAIIPVHSFAKMKVAIKNKKFEKKSYGSIPVLKYNEVIHCELAVVNTKDTSKSLCFGPLHTEFDNKGNAYTSCFLSNNILKWHLGETCEARQKVPAYYNIGHVSVVGGANKNPYGKYMLSLNKVTQDRYLPTGPEMAHAAQLYDISGDKIKMILDFPTMGEPHYANAIAAEKIQKKSKRIYKLSKNSHPYAAKSEKEAGVIRKGKTVHVKLTAIRTHFKPDTVTVNQGDRVIFHVTNLEQDFDYPHGFAVFGTPIPNLLVMPGQTKSIEFTAKKKGVFPFYCTDFCSALHQEMQNYIRVR